MSKRRALAMAMPSPVYVLLLMSILHSASSLSEKYFLSSLVALLAVGWCLLILVWN